MNIMIINGSPRKKGLISQMLGIMREEAEKRGNTVETEVPLAIGDVLIERGCYHGCTDVACAATDKCGLRDLTEPVGIFKILQTAQGLIFIGPPTIEIGFCTCPFRTF